METHRQEAVTYRGADDFDVSIDAFIEKLLLQSHQSILHHFRLTLCVHVPLDNKVYITGWQVEACSEASKHIHLATYIHTARLTMLTNTKMLNPTHSLTLSKDHHSAHLTE